MSLPQNIESCINRLAITCAKFLFHVKFNAQKLAQMNIIHLSFCLPLSCGLEGDIEFKKWHPRCMLISAITRNQLSGLAIPPCMCVGQSRST